MKIIRFRKLYFVFSLLLFFNEGLSAKCPEKSLCVAVPGRPAALGNPYATLPIGAINPMHVLYDSLTVIGDNGSILPSLALKWEKKSDKSWLFYLREGVHFSNGESFNAQTVVDVITYLRSDSAAGYPVASETKIIKDANVVGNYIVQINTTDPDAILPKRMSFVYMVPMDYWQSVGVNEFGINPSGSGPFKLKDWGVTSGTYIFEKNNLSWRKSLYFDEIHFTAVGDVVSRAQSMISGQIDLSFKLSLDLLFDLDLRGFETIAKQTYSVGAWAMKQMDSSSPLSNQKVRMAMNLAVDRDAIAKTILSGVSSPVSQMATPQVFGYNPDLKPYLYDPDKARHLLSEAGFENGIKLKAIVRSDPSVPESTLINQVVAQNLSNVGIDVVLKAVPGTRWITMYFSGDWDGADLLETSFNNTIHGDVIRSIETASCMKTGAFFCDNEMLELIEDSNREFDNKIRKQKLQNLISKLHYNPPALYLFPYFDTLAFNSRLKALPMTGQKVNLELITVN
jgi:peptide/nickel transport system substrate-binding protein